MPDDFARTRQVFEQVLRIGGGASFAVYHQGELVLDLAGGTTRQGVPWAADTLVMCQSTTKGVTATALHLQASKGLLDYDTPVRNYWPEFGKPTVLVRHVLSHSAGLHKMRSRTKSLSEVFDWQHQTRALEVQQPAYEPGTRSGYHALTYGWLAGELIRRVSGLALQDVIATQIAAPLGLTGLYLGCPPQERHRVVPCDFRYSPLPGSCLPPGSGKLTTDPRAMDVPVPAIGGFFDARSLAAHYAMLAAGGVWQGTRMLDADVLRRATEVQTTGRDVVLRRPMDWRLGYHRLSGHRTGVLPGAYGHFGFGGTAAFADPQHELAAAFTCDRSVSLRDTRVPRLIDALLTDLP